MEKAAADKQKSDLPRARCGGEVQRCVAEGVPGVEVGAAAQHQRDWRGAASLGHGVECCAPVVVERVDEGCEAA